MPAAVPAGDPADGAGNRALGILLDDPGAGRPVHVEHIPARAGQEVPWPSWVPAPVAEAFAARGIRAPWSHQALAADHAQAGRNVIISTAAASGKSLGYLLPALTAVLAGDTVLYLTPTKALAADQLRSIRALGLPGVQAAVFDGDSTRAERDWARSHARYLLTTPDMLHRALLPRHNRWSGFFRRLSYVVVDECHGYRGVFGSHVAHVLRRLRRVVAHHAPATATACRGRCSCSPRPRSGRRRACARPADRAGRRGGYRGRVAARGAGLRAVGTAADRSRGEAGARLRRTATAQTADLLGGWSGRTSRRSRSSGPGAAPRWSRWPRAGPWTPVERGPTTGSPPTARGTCPRTGGGSSRRCPTGA